MKGQTSIDGGKPLVYATIIILFGVFMAVSLVLVKQGKELEAKVPESFRDAIDVQGMQNICRMLDWNNLDHIKTCFTPQHRAYRFTFSLGEEEQVVTTENWGKGKAPRVSNKYGQLVMRDGELVESEVIWEAQHASFLE